MEIKSGPVRFCACGCGSEVTRTFKKGHHWRGRSRGERTDAHRRKLSEAGRGNTNKRGKSDPRGRVAKLGSRNPNFGKRGADAPTWRGGFTSSRGYVYVFKPEHARANRKGYVAQHVLIAEATLGRELLRGEVVHHIDGDKSNNDGSNLWVCSASAHALAHRSAFDVVVQLVRSGHVTFDHVAGRYALAS